MAFRFNILADFYWEAKIDEVLRTISRTEYRSFFKQQDYGNALNGLTVVLMCQDPTLGLKQRIRFYRKEKEIDMDIMLDLPLFISISQKEREKIVVNKLISEIPPVIKKYKIADFDLIKFETDVKNCMSKIL